MNRLKKILDRKSLKFKLWTYFGGFALIIMLILWLLEIILLNTFYENMKLNQIVKIGKTLVAEYGKDNFEEYIYNISFKNGIFAQLVNQNGRPVESDEAFVSFGIPRTNPKEFRKFIQQMQNSTDKTVTYRTDFANGIHTVVFGAELVKNGTETLYLYVSSPLAPVGAAQQVLQNQLLIVSGLALVTAFALSYFIAKKFSKPLTKLSLSAAELATGNYKVVFDEGGYTEINQLASSLNDMTKELSKTDTLRRDLIANVSHDLRTPLTIIKSYAEMIRDISGENSEKRQLHTGVIIDETDRLNLLVSDLLDLSKLESGTAELSYSRFDLSELASNILQGFQLLSEQQGYSFSLEGDSECFVHADVHRIEQAVYNLISNAVNYTGMDKKVSISVKKNEDEVFFSVRDTGVGLSEEEQKRVWERYYKSSRSHCRAWHGTGIGLSIVKNVLDAHGASYGINSKLGSGSEFWFKLYNRKMD